MAITLSSIAASSLASLQAGGRSGVDPAAQAFEKADKRIQPQRELAAVQLSSFGKVKSAFADVQTAAAALSDSEQTGSEASIRRLDGNFVKAFNSAVETARSAAAQPGATVEGGRARTAEADLRRSAGTDAAVADQQALAAAVRQTVSAQANRFSDSLNSGAAAYQRVFSL
ncbi:MAG: hypothetical protein IPK39_08970 [Sulfuritalea sp.]|nr:hypothetical protein [Sulfuritalea sp.]